MTVPLHENLPPHDEERFQQTIVRFTQAGSEGRWELGPIEEGVHPRLTLFGPHHAKDLTAEEAADLAYLRTVLPVDVVPWPNPVPAARSI